MKQIIAEQTKIDENKTEKPALVMQGKDGLFVNEDKLFCLKFVLTDYLSIPCF